ncbi:MAG: hypothetical protein RR115_09090, partial [Hydrogenoanaerobacterium sp.]
TRRLSKMEYVEILMPYFKIFLESSLRFLREIGIPLIPVLLLAIIAYFIKIDKFIKLRDKITIAKKKAMKLQDLNKIRNRAAMYEREVDKEYKAGKITEQEKLFLDNLIAQIKYINISYK